MKTAVVTSATGEPLTLSEVKAHLRISTGETEENTYLNALITAARREVENLTSRKLMPQTWKVCFDDWPSGDSFEIPYAPLKQIPSTGLKYTSSTGGSTTFSSTAWAADIVSEPGRLVLDYNDDWPTETLHNRNPIEITFKCGYGTVGGSSVHRLVPKDIKHAMLLLIGHWHENREHTVVGPSIAEMPFGVKAILGHYRLYHF